MWELAEDERLLVNRFSKQEHDHVVTSISTTAGGAHAISGGMDCRLVVGVNPQMRIKYKTGNSFKVQFSSCFSFREVVFCF